MKLPSIFLCLLLLCISALPIFSQDAESHDINDNAPEKRNILADTGYTTLGVILSNVFLNYGARLGDQPYANMTFDDIKLNWTTYRWFWEDGDRFLINQLGHAYQGSTYFASARINGFGFYPSILFIPLGSIMWETIMEPEPSINDVISTITSGMALGEILHRLFLEIDSSPSVVATIGGLPVSPIGTVNKLYKRPAFETGGGNIYDLSVSAGVDKAFAYFPRHEENEDSWKYPGGHINTNVVYGNPFVQESKKPYDHFELFAGFTTNTNSYHAAVITDGYLFSIKPSETKSSFTSTGLSMHFDFFNATNDLIDNMGYGNLQMSSSAAGWTVKHMHCFSEEFFLEIKAHASFVFWGNSMYNGYDESADYWVSLGNNRNTYGMGENIKSFFTISHAKAGKLELVAHGYHLLALPVTGSHSTGSVFFVYSSLSYDFPLTARIAIGAKGTFWGLFGLYDSAENVNRRLVSSCLYVKYML